METPTSLVAKIQHFLVNPPTPKTKAEKKAFEQFQVKWGAEFSRLMVRYFTKQEPRTGEAVLSPSSLGKCTRQLAYRYHGVEGEPLTYETIMAFMTGDFHELVTYMLAEAVGSPIENIQAKIDIDGVTGSIDGTVGDTVVDVKSMSAASYDINHREGAMSDSFGYLTQMAHYVVGMGKSVGEWITINKNKGTMGVLTGNTSPYLVAAAKAKKEIVLASSLDRLPARDYSLETEVKYKKPTGLMKLGMQCKFCDFKGLCWDITDTKPGWNNSVTYYSGGPKND